MAYEENVKSISYDSDATIGIYTGVPGQPGSAVPNGGKQFHALTLTGKNQVGLAGAGAVIFGILQNKPQRPGQAATVAYDGVSACVAGAAVAVGNILTTDAQGRLVPLGAGVAPAGTRTLRAVTPAAGAGELFSAQFV